MDFSYLPACFALGGAAFAAADRSGERSLRRAERAGWASLAAAAGLIAQLWAAPGPADGLAASLTLLTSFVGAVVLSFSTRYMRADPRRRAYATRVSLLLASVLVLVHAGNALVFLPVWVASGQLLAGLIGHAGTPAAAAAAQQARRAFVIGDAALLAALALLGAHTGSPDIAAMINGAASLPAALQGLAAGLLLLAAMARSALPPFSAWLMRSMTAPTPVSALMHAGLVNAGGFLLIRFAAVLAAAPAVQALAIGAGLFAAFWGGFLQLVRPEIKQSLAGSTIAQMGFMILTCGLGGDAAALWHLFAHGLFKAWLFLGSGAAIGPVLRPARPQGAAITAIAALLALAAIAWLDAHGLVTGAALLPTALAIATGVGATLSAGTKRMFLLLPVLSGLYLAGLGATEALLAAPPTASPGGDGLVFALAALFLAGGVAQALLRQGGTGLPRPLHVRLLNA
ncbi:MAG TPA: proton-conducting transporter membrane subunit [Acidiphilium sp.]|jgi:NADH:ubiquinone oxidoreductase subunit 5 (subunit L)/multisubunit Na+/H+ antiporter MnhA subunit|uniref:proton-conducting transporter transmembrane domain-containing protein n=1 Tax=unclassified Acidiphilium TaxID=2617493 RepID=UPI00157ABCF5|nr:MULTISPECIES: proton-conducting transporter membrane subunit [unclassified Acidiphilium]HQT61131.1 proton-conducting transporter membrane subunit [Acidiphilium sp.]HQU11178.1 proton-conducting transporter membrane subunit [Acidiphilium sp.]